MDVLLSNKISRKQILQLDTKEHTLLLMTLIPDAPRCKNHKYQTERRTRTTNQMGNISAVNIQAIMATHMLAIVFVYYTENRQTIIAGDISNFQQQRH